MQSILSLTLVLLAPLTHQDIGTRTPVPSPEVLRDGQTLSLYDVRDILIDMGRGFPAPRLGQIEPLLPRVEARAGASSSSETPSEPTDDEIKAMCKTNGAVLAAFLTRNLQPPVANPAERIACSSEGSLVCNLVQQQHQGVQTMLDVLRRHEGYVEIRARFLTAPVDVVEQWGLDRTSVLATPEALDALERKLAGNSLFEQVTAPLLTMLPGQRANISVMNQVTFVQDWILQVVEPNAREIADPQIGVLHEGTALDVRALPLPGGLFDLDLEVQHAKLQRPMPIVQTKLGSSGQAVEISLPEVDVQRFRAQFAILSGTGVLLVGAGDDPSRKLVVLVTARHVDRQSVRSR